MKNRLSLWNQNQQVYNKLLTDTYGRELARLPAMEFLLLGKQASLVVTKSATKY